MEFLIVPLIVGLFVFPGGGPANDKALADFSRLHSAIDESVYVVDRTGHERLMTLLEAGERSITLGIGAQTVSMNRDAVLRVDRARDRTRDGVLKGGAFGLFTGLLALKATGARSGGLVIRSVFSYGTIGYLLDRANTNREALYRSP
jgi:hypothetical protein